MARRRKSGNGADMLITIMVAAVFGFAILVYKAIVIAVKGMIFVICIVAKSIVSKIEESRSEFNYGKRSSHSDPYYTMKQIDLMDGICFEHCVAQLLRHNGYTNVKVTKSSGDFGVDIICQKDSDTYAIQCKHYSEPVGVKSVQEVYAGSAMYQADKCAVVTNNYFTSHAVQMARSLGVILCNRSGLEKLCQREKR